MPFIAFLGCDGSGKSSVIEQLATQLEAGGVRVTLGHWRPRPFSRNKENSHQNTADNPHNQTPRKKFSSIAKLGWLSLNWWGAWLKDLRKDSKNGFVVYDRYHGDLLIDPKRYRYGGPMFLAQLACLTMPQPDLVFFLDAEPDVLFRRKQEVSREALISARELYLEQAGKQKRFRIIDASKPLNEVVEAVYREIRSFQSK